MRQSATPIWILKMNVTNATDEIEVGMEGRNEE